MFKISLFQLEERFRSAGFNAISSVDATGDFVILSGDQTADYAVDDLVEIRNSSDNNGRYTVTNVVLNANSNTEVYLDGDLVSPTTAGELHYGALDAMKVSGTEKVYSTNNPGSNSFDVIRVGDIEESLEIEEGRFQLDNLSLTAQGIAADFFGSYDDVTRKPFALVVENESQGTTLWHGVVDPESISYNPETKYTALEAFSWDHIVGQNSTPARSVFETELFEDYTSESDPYTVLLPLNTDDGYDLSQELEPGQVLVLDTSSGDFRTTITSVAAQTDHVEVQVSDQPQANFSSGTVNAVDERELQSLYRYVVDIVDPALWSTIKNDLEGDLLDVKITDGTNHKELRVQDTANIPSGRGRGMYKLVPDDKTIRIFWNEESQIGSWFTTNSLNYTVAPDTVVEASSSVQILGYDLYGYTPTYGRGRDILKEYESSKVIGAIYSLDKHGLLKYVFSGVNGISAVSDDSFLEKGIILPDNPHSATKIILADANWFLRYNCTLDANGIPSLSAEIIRRKDVNETDKAPVSVANVKSWNEKSADLTPEAVVVKPNHNYFQNDDDHETVGFWFEYTEDGNTVTPDTLTAEERKRQGLPSGNRVIEIEVATVPEYVGDLFSGDGPKVRNDNRLKEIAKRFYKFYQDLKRPANGTLAERRTDLLGEFASASELNIDGSGGRTIFVTRQSISLSGRETQVEGRIGEYIQAAGDSPVAKIHVGDPIVDIDGDGTVPVVFDGTRSYDPAGEQLTYEWYVGTTLVSEEPIYENTGADELAIGSHSVDLTVTNQSGQSTTVSKTIDVISKDNPLPEQASFDSFDLEKERVLISGTYYGEVRLYPQIPTSEISAVEYRSKSGGELTSGDTTWSAATYVTPSSGEAYYRMRVELASKHVSNIEARVTFTAERNTFPKKSTFAFSSIPQADFISHSIGVDGNGDIILNAEGDADTQTTGGVEVYVADTLSGLDTATPTAYDNPVTNQTIFSGLAEGGSKYVRVVLITAADGTDGEKWTQFVSNMNTSSSPSFEQVEIQEGGIIDGQLDADGNPELHFFHTDGTNYATVIINDLVVKGSIDQKNTTELLVEDQWVVVNSGQTGTPSLNGGIEVERGDAANHRLEWDEGLDRFGHYDEGAAAFTPLALNDGTLQTDLNADLLDGYHGADLAARAENETITGEWTFNANVGIGTAPSYPLHVSGTAQVTDIRATNRVNVLTSDGTSGNYTTLAYAFDEARGWGYNKADDAVFYNAANGKIPFRVHAGPSGSFVLNSSGTAIFGNNAEVNGTLDVDGLAQFGNDVLPQVNYASNLGSSTKKWLSLHVAELRVETIVAQERRVTVGGRFNVGYASTLYHGLPAGATTIAERTLEVEHNVFNEGDIAHFEKEGQLEFISVGSWSYEAAGTTNDYFRMNGDWRGNFSGGDSIYIPSGVHQGTWTINSVTYNDNGNGDTYLHVQEDITSTGSGSILYINKSDGGYDYRIASRNLDGTGVNAWDKADGVFNTGSVGDGFIDQYARWSLSTTSRTESNIDGPTIAFMERTGTAYDAISDRAVLGNLKGNYDYTTKVFGAAFGDYSGEWLAADPSNGFRILDGATKRVGLSAGKFSLYDGGGAEKFYVTDTGTLWLDGSGTFTGTITANAGTIANWDIGTSTADRISSSTADFDVVLDSANGTIYARQSGNTTNSSVEYVNVGQQIDDTNGFNGYYGLSVKTHAGNFLFQAVSDNAGNRKLTFAGASFAEDAVWAGGTKGSAHWQLNSDGSGYAAGKAIQWDSTGTLTANKVLAGTVDTDQLVTDAVTAGKISVTTLDAVAADMGLLTAGEIRVGSGIVGTDFTGIRLRYDSANFAGYLEGINGDVVQAYFDSDGIFKAGSGSVRLSTSGLEMDAGSSANNTLTWTDGTGVEMGELWSNTSGELRLKGSNKIVMFAGTGTSLQIESGQKIAINGTDIGLQFPECDPASVPSASTGSVILFMDSSSGAPELKYKTSDGTVYTLVT